MTSTSRGMNKQPYTHSRTKEHFEGHDNPLDFSVIKCRQLSDTVSDSTPQIPSRKHPSVKFWCNSKENVRNDPRLLRRSYSSQPVFLHFNQNMWQQTERRSTQEKLAISKKPDVQVICKNIKQCHPLIKFVFVLGNMVFS